MCRKILFLFIGILITGVIFMSCSDDSGTDPVPDPFIKLVFPKGGESLQRGVSYEILWEDNIPGKVNIEIWKGVGTSAVKLDSIKNVPSTGSCNYLVPINAAVAGDYKVKIVSADDDGLSSVSADYFAVSAYVSDGNDEPGTATALTIPHRGDYAIYAENDVDWYRVYLNADQRYYFENFSDNDFDSEFFLYRGNGAGNALVTQVAANDDYHSSQPYIDYTAPEEGYYFLRVAYYSNNPVKRKQLGTGYYTLVIKEHLFLTSPNGGEVWKEGSNHNITWNADVTGDVILTLEKESGTELTIATVLASAGTYSWTIPSGIEPRADYKIKVARKNNLNSIDESDHYICISADVMVNVLGDWGFNWYWKVYGIISFYSDNTWSAGTYQITGNGVRWDYYGLDVYYMGIVDGDKMYGTMVDGDGNAGKGWDAQRLLNVLTPNGGGIYSAGEVVTITWHETLTAQNVIVDLYQNDAFSRNITTVNVNNYTSYNWTVPGNLATGTRYKIRLTSTTSDIYDESDDYFTIELPVSAEFTEDFSDGIADGWRIVNGLWSITDGNYNVTYESLTTSSCYYDRIFTGNYQIETRLKQNEGYFAGIFVNGKHSVLAGNGMWDDYIGLFINSGDSYYLERGDSGSYYGTGWISSSELVQGDGEWNTIRLDVNNSTGDYDIYINGTYIASVNQTNFNQGEIGLIQFDYDTVRSASFDHVKVGPYPAVKGGFQRKYAELRTGGKSFLK
jgi:hypothetical protein